MAVKRDSDQPGSVTDTTNILTDHSFPQEHENVFSQASSGVGESSAVPKIIAHFDMEDIKLWHQFVTATAKTISRPWERELPVLALSCDYLMHGILAAAALHLAYLYPDSRDKYEILSTQHQDLALKPFRHAMSNVTPENCNHLFAFSTLLTVFNVVPFRSTEFLVQFSDRLSDNGLSNWIVFIRGCASIFQQAQSHIKSGPLGFLITQEDKMETATAGGTRYPHDKDDKSLVYLTQHLLTMPSIKSTTTVEEMEAYSDAITRLRKLLAAASVASDMASKRTLSSIWLVTVADIFIRLLREQRPPAVIILAHYCLLLKRCEECWYMEHRAHDLFEAVRQGLREEWVVHIKHPLTVFRGRASIDKPGQ
jgi:hypothetical protein